MKESINKKERYPLDHLGFSCIVNVDKKGQYSIDTTHRVNKNGKLITMPTMTLTGKTVNEIEERYKSLIVTLIDSVL